MSGSHQYVGIKQIQQLGFIHVTKSSSYVARFYLVGCNFDIKLSVSCSIFEGAAENVGGHA